VPGKIPTIVVVVDDASMSQAMERILRAGGFEVVLFASAEAALEANGIRSVAYLVLDIRLPGIPGFELYRRLVYDLTKDWTQFNDVAEDNPAKLKFLQDRFWVQAAKYNVLPLDASVATRVVVPKPSLGAGRPVMPSTCGLRPRANAPSKRHPASANVWASRCCNWYRRRPGAERWYAETTNRGERVEKSLDRTLQKAENAGTS
jgi:hypothetical protein